MVIHKCDRCLREFTKKSQYEYHINRKHICQLHPSVSTHDKSQEVDESSMLLILKELEHMRTELKSVKEELVSVKKENVKMKNKSKKDITKIKQNVNLSLTRKSQPKHNNVNIDKNFVNNGTVNMNIVAFGKEKMDFDIDEISSLCQGHKTIPNFIDFVHFNENKPENHNVYMPSRKNKNEVFVHNGSKWILADKHVITEQLIDKGTAYVEGRLEELKTKISKSKLNAVERSINAYNDVNDSNHVETTKKITKDVELILYNNKDIVLHKLT